MPCLLMSVQFVVECVQLYLLLLYWSMYPLGLKRFPIQIRRGVGGVSVNYMGTWTLTVLIATFSEPGRKMMAHVTLVAFAAPKGFVIKSREHRRIYKPREAGQSADTWTYANKP